MSDLSAGAQLTLDVLEAVKRAKDAGLSPRRALLIVADVAADLSDLADTEAAKQKGAGDE